MMPDFQDIAVDIGPRRKDLPLNSFGGISREHPPLAHKIKFQNKGSLVFFVCLESIKVLESQTANCERELPFLVHECANVEMGSETLVCTDMVVIMMGRDDAI